MSKEYFEAFAQELGMIFKEESDPLDDFAESAGQDDWLSICRKVILMVMPLFSQVRNGCQRVDFGEASESQKVPARSIPSFKKAVLFKAPSGH